MFTDGWLGIILGILLSVAVLFILGMILWGVFYAIDSWFQPKKQASGVIDGHDFTAAHTTYTFIDGVAYLIYNPDSWSIGVRVGDRHSWMSCSKNCHDNYRDGQKIIATFKNGRLSDHMYVQAVSFA
jgi:hypothetical protein